MLNNNAFKNFTAQAIETPDEIFAIDENIKEFVDLATANSKTDKAKLEKLIFALFDRTELALDYSAVANTIATETFYSGNANCLSLTILTYAMAQYMGFETNFQNVLIPEYWTRREGKTLINLHINLAVKLNAAKYDSFPQNKIIIDFDPQQSSQNFKVRPLEKSQIVSNFYTNKAADFMISDQKDKAYAYLMAAIQSDQMNASAWMNLGVLFAQNDWFEDAENYYQHAIMLQPSYTAAYQNLALLHRRRGKETEALITLKRLHKKRISNPYYHLMQGDVAFEGEQFANAIKHYKNAISLNPKAHEFHFALAQAYFRLGDNKNARLYLQKAKKRAHNENTIEQYASKISFLRSINSANKESTLTTDNKS